MPTITIDDTPYQVPDGATVLQACQMARVRVPYYCYHPGLSIAGNCRICLVEIDGNAKLQISCNTRVTDGMNVRTTTHKVQQGQREVLEFLLVNHPLDCPVCDQAGECELQNYYLEFGAYDPKFNEAKVHKPKAVPISQKIMLDAERCILCSRCVRFCDEITKTGELAIFNRGDHAEIGIHPQKTLDENQYAGNVVDVCPVGALTDRDFRFQCRVWYLGTQDSICPGCAQGCNIQVHYNKEREWRPHIADGRRIMRLRPRYNAEVNQWWMCDAGRYGFRFVDEQRLLRPRLRAGGELKEIDWSQAIHLATESLHARLAQGHREGIAIIASTHLTNEDLFLVKRLFCDTLQVPLVTADLPLVPGDHDAFLIKADKSPNTRGAQALGLMGAAGQLTGEQILRRIQQGRWRLLWVFGHDLSARCDEALVRHVVANTDLVIFQGPNHHRFAEAAHLVLPSTTFVEKDGTLTNWQGRVQRIRPVVPPLGESRGEWDVLQAIGQSLGLTTDFQTSEQVFSSLAEQVPAFRDLSYQTIGRQGALLHTR